MKKEAYTKYKRKIREPDAGWKHFVSDPRIFGLTHTGLIEFDPGQSEK